MPLPIRRAVDGSREPGSVGGFGVRRQQLGDFADGGRRAGAPLRGDGNDREQDQWSPPLPLRSLVQHRYLLRGFDLEGIGHGMRPLHHPLLLSEKDGIRPTQRTGHSVGERGTIAAGVDLQN
jgi:hypothetical protein